MAKVLGAGGVFFKCRDKEATKAWYAEKLGFDIADWGGVAFNFGKPGDPGDPRHRGAFVWSPFAADTNYFDPGTRDFMINFRVDDLDAFLVELKAKGVEPVGRDDSDPSGRFAWIVDPDGIKIELWEPPLSKA